GKLDEKLGQEQAKASREKADLDQQQQALEIKAKLQGADKVLNDTRAAIADLKKAALPITITGLPTGVTPGAKAVPYATVLTVQCASGPRALTNYNFPVSDTFSWSPEACGDTALEIKVETLTLAKKYPGPRGFGRFLREFYDGEHSFRAGDFPSQRTRLEELGIRNISVRYEFSGLDAVLRQMDQLAQLERREKEKLAEKQKLQETQDKLESRKLEQKRAELKQQPAAERDERPAVKAALPEKIAACWDSSGVATARAPQKPQTLLQRAEDEVKMVGRELFGRKEAAPKPAPVPAAPLKPEGAQPAPFEGYMVQLGLFGPENAARLKSALRSQGVEPHQYEVTREERVYYKIRIGPYPSEADAAEVAREMDAKFHIQSLIVRPTKSVSAAN
ncbi:MAG: SPOR domain-containing protein, partial [Betaproteobacteria bacterium]|nr:SPOR domain-containing protein [Betaproteobacteria bacterium]